jgi:hypothetical protein
LTENHAMKVYWRSGGIHAFYLGTRWRWVVRLKPRPLYPKEKSA